MHMHTCDIPTIMLSHAVYAIREAAAINLNLFIINLQAQISNPYYKAITDEVFFHVSVVSGT